MEKRKIKIIIAGRGYEFNVSEKEEEIFRKVGKQIEQMIKDFETNFAVEDKQGALAMCALRLGINAEMGRINLEKNIQNSNDRVMQISQLLDQIERQNL